MVLLYCIEIQTSNNRPIYETSYSIHELTGDNRSSGKEDDCLPGNKDCVIAVFAVKGAYGTA